MKGEVRVQFLHDWHTHRSLQNRFERGIWVWRITAQQLTCRWFPIPADLQPAAHTRILSVCPTGPVHGPLHCLPVHRSEWRRTQSYGSNTQEWITMRTCARTWTPETLSAGGETRATVPLPASSPGSAAAPAESPPVSEFQHEPSHLTDKTCDWWTDSDWQTVSEK